MAIVVYAADWTIRLTKLPAVRKRSFWVWKTIAMTIRPMMMGSDPSWPERTSVHQSRAAAAMPP